MQTIGKFALNLTLPTVIISLRTTGLLVHHPSKICGLSYMITCASDNPLPQSIYQTFN